MTSAKGEETQVLWKQNGLAGGPRSQRRCPGDRDTWTRCSPQVPCTIDKLLRGEPEKTSGPSPISSPTHVSCYPVSVFNVWVCPLDSDRVSGNSARPGSCMALGQHASSLTGALLMQTPSSLSFTSFQTCPSLLIIFPKKRYRLELTMSLKLDVEAFSIACPLLYVYGYSDFPWKNASVKCAHCLGLQFIIYCNHSGKSV